MIIALMVLTVPAFAGVEAGTTGRIGGAVTGDVEFTLIFGDDHETVVGATVSSLDSVHTCISDIEGKCLLESMHVGTYTFVITHFEFESDTVVGVPVSPRAKTKLRRKLILRDVNTLNRRIGESGETPSKKPVSTVDDLLTQVTGVVTNQGRESIIKGTPQTVTTFTTMIDSCGDTMPVVLFNDRLPSIYEFEGTVIDIQTGEPIGGAIISLADESRWVMTDSDGRFELRSLPPNCYTLEIWHPEYETVLLERLRLNYQRVDELLCELTRKTME